jgi:polysaccharide deacetylase 2 family uncharacterized protein YibQ
MSDENSEDDLESEPKNNPSKDITDELSENSLEGSSNNDIENNHSVLNKNESPNDLPEDAVDDDINKDLSLENDDDHQEASNFEEVDNDEVDNDNDDDSGGGKKWFLIITFIIIGLAIIGGGAVFLLNDASQKKAVLSLKISNKPKMKAGRKRMVASAAKPIKSLTTISPKTDSSSTAPKSLAITSKKAGKTTNKKTPEETAPDNSQPSGTDNLPSVTRASFKGIPMVKNPKPLANIDAALGESLGGGIIPKISADGRQPWKFYARPFSRRKTVPPVGIIIKGLGLSRIATTAAINHSPAEVTLAFDPYGKDVANWVSFARKAGHETLITVPMEPDDFPNSDPGPFALQTDLPAAENINRLYYILSVSMGNIGLLQMMGTRFTTSQTALVPVLAEIRKRGLLMIDNGMVPNSQIVSIASKTALPFARSDIFIDRDPSRKGIMLNLAKLEAAAKQNNGAIGIARSLPNTISLIVTWSKTLASKKLVLAPISGIVKISGKPEIKSTVKATVDQ